MPSNSSQTADTRAREQRMLVVLLAATDPLAIVEHGGRPLEYRATATSVLRALQAGGGIDELFSLFRHAGRRLEQVDRFVRAALRWWTYDAAARRPAAA